MKPGLLIAILVFLFKSSIENSFAQVGVSSVPLQRDSLFGYGNSGPAGGHSTNDSPAEIKKCLVDQDWRTRLDATIQLDEKRKRSVRFLMEILNGTNSPEIKVNAIVVLGEYRAAESAPIIAKHLDWERKGSGYVLPLYQEGTEVRFYPVSGALIKIGLPAIAPLLDEVQKTDDNKTIENCISICARIEGAEIIQFRLEKILAKETDEKKRKRIQMALDTIKAEVDKK